jgi:hypothetical protein
MNLIIFYAQFEKTPTCYDMKWQKKPEIENLWNNDVI